MILSNFQYKGIKYDRCFVYGSTQSDIDMFLKTEDKRNIILLKDTFEVDDQTMNKVELFDWLHKNNGQVYNCCTYKGSLGKTVYSLVKPSKLDLELRLIITMRYQGFPKTVFPKIKVLDLCDYGFVDTFMQEQSSYLEYFSSLKNIYSDYYFITQKGFGEPEQYIRIRIKDFKIFERLIAKYKMIMG